jgi:hypothetical protein
MNRPFAAALAAGLVLGVLSGAARADERPLIWQPIKNSDTSYAVKLGLRISSPLEPQAGFDLGVDASKAGAVLDTPLRFWTSVKTADEKRPGYQMRRDIGVNYDGIAGSAAISMNYYEKQIATPAYNLEHQSTYALRYDGLQGDWTGIEASQSLKLRRHETGTAFIASANSAESFSTFGAGLGLEQQLGKNITVSGNLNRSFTDPGADTIASVNASYNYKW